MRRHSIVFILPLLLLLVAACSQATSVPENLLEPPDEGVARITYFYASDCNSCDEIFTDVLTPVLDQCGAHIKLKMVDIADPDGYAVFIDTEAYFIGESGRWEIPTVVTHDKVMVGGASIRQKLQPELQCIFGAGGNDWPPVDTLIAYGIPDDANENPLDFSAAGDDLESCVTDEAAICASSNPISVLYVTDTACSDVCDRTLYDLRYLQGVYPEMSFEERDMKESKALVNAMLDELGYEIEEAETTPAIFVGQDYLAGDDVTLQALRDVLDKYVESGAIATWYLLDVD